MTTYEGWSNYPTWCVNLWLANDEGLYNEALGVVRTAIADVKTGEYLTPEQAIACDVEDALKDWVEELADTMTGEQLQSSMVSDILTWALGQVDWRELAESWIETVDELRKAEAK